MQEVIGFFSQFPEVTTLIGIVSFVIAAGGALIVHLMSENTKRLQLLPEADRAAKIDESLRKYGVDVEGMSGAEKATLLRKEMEYRFRNRRLLTISASVVFMFTIAVLLLSAIIVPPSGTVSIEGRVPSIDKADTIIVHDMEDPSQREIGTIERVTYDPFAHKFMISFTMAGRSGWFTARHTTPSTAKIYNVTYEVRRSGEFAIAKVEEVRYE